MTRKNDEHRAENSVIGSLAAHRALAFLPLLRRSGPPRVTEAPQPTPDTRPTPAPPPSSRPNPTPPSPLDLPSVADETTAPQPERRRARRHPIHR